MKIAYLDCFSGIAGDMLLGALLDAGLPEETLRRDLARLGVPGYELDISQVQRHGLRATHLQVRMTEAPTARHLPDILGLIEDSDLDAAVKERAAAVFHRLAVAEGKVHGTPPDSVHFHEVGAVDAIVDVVGAAAGLAALGIERLACSPLPLGRGWVQSAHGRLPVPAPATAELVRGIPTWAGDAEAELVTPTGAALVTTLADEFGAMPPMTVSAVGYGAGTRELDSPNVLRLFIGEGAAQVGRDRVAVLETNIDDMNPEIFDHVMERLLSAGALDVFLTPIAMKKNRPATLLTVLAEPAGREALLEIIFRETTTLGVRCAEMERRCLARESIEVETPWGAVGVKLGRLGDEVVTVAPEYEDCRRVAREHHVPLRLVYEHAQRGGREGQVR
jgi:uncharacterized protein (TIGR00299 family) protein